MNTPNRCPRCDKGPMLTWDELTTEERAVVARLPASVDYLPEERRQTHRWCVRCWHESASKGEVDV